MEPERITVVHHAVMQPTPTWVYVVGIVVVLAIMALSIAGTFWVLRNK